jgi:iron complex outermembrane receptor protein
LSWRVDDESLLWSAISRAVRTPSRIDREFYAPATPPFTVLRGGPDFDSEKLISYEVGYRTQPHERVLLSLSTFYNDYDDLRSIQVTPATLFPLSWDNLIEGSTYGVEFWASWQATSWLRLSPGFRSLHKRLSYSAGALPIVGLDEVGNDPTSQASLKSSIIFGRFSADAMLRYVGELPNATPDYTELGARFAWRASDSLEFSVSGVNLLDERHVEYAAPVGRELRRAVYAEARVSF